MANNILIADRKLNEVMPNIASIDNWQLVHENFRTQSDETLRQLLESINAPVRVFAKIVLNERNAIVIKNKICSDSYGIKK